MEHRAATLAELDSIMELAEDARRFLRASGVDQWQDDYPASGDFEADIAQGKCEAFFMDGELAGIITVLPGPESDYANIYDGAWRSERPYCSLHRVIVSEKYRGKGVGTEMFSYAENIARALSCGSLRVDTHRDNRAMRGLIEKSGFIYCGVIYLDGDPDNGIERVAYEKLL
ncbi:MAG: GNAT family N-acetyltransferase [Oscillospiraceae bacterium]